MSLVARRATWVQENYKRGTVWYLPPAFADDIFSGKSAYELANTYSKDWMPSNPKLKYVSHLSTTLIYLLIMLF
jgi:hypothetical protein